MSFLHLLAEVVMVLQKKKKIEKVRILKTI